jgi:hypothetical protein
MELQEGMPRKIAISFVAVAVFVGLVFGIGTTFGDSGLGPTGGLAMVAAIVLFIFLMAGVGFLINR